MFTMPMQTQANGWEYQDLQVLMEPLEPLPQGMAKFQLFTPNPQLLII